MAELSFICSNCLDFPEHILMAFCINFIHKLAAAIKDKQRCSWNLGNIFKSTRMGRSH